MTIRLLPTKIINRIAAGEVVERPASVVKELVENSLDAGATEIKISVQQGGRNLIQVVDNGCGIPQEEIKLALERHATSKLPNDDFLNIKHMGFRGEALPSIASISRMKITSRIQNSETGWSIKVEGGEIIQGLTPSIFNCGTKIEIRDLFFATPNRLKFLKTEKAETQYIIDIIIKVALANPRVKFACSSGDKELFAYPSCDDYLQRLVAIKGQEFKENIVEVHSHKDDLTLEAYAGIPTYNRANTNYLYLFVNNRPVRDGLLISAVKAAYQDFIPKGRYPVVILFLTMSNHLVDVNVHPTKAEVRFQDKNLVRNFIISELKLAIKKSLYRATSETTKQALNYFIDPQKVYSATKQVLSDFNAPSRDFIRGEALGERIDTNCYNLVNSIKPGFTSESKPKTEVKDNELNKEVITLDNKKKPLGEACYQIYKTYILSITGESIFLIDQHAAHERLVYEHLKSTVKIERQSLLMPELIELDPAQVEMLIQYKNQLQKLGMIIDQMGYKSIIVREIPAILGTPDVRKLTYDILDTITSFGTTLLLEEKLEDIYGTFACHTSIRAGRQLNISEMNAMLRQMEDIPHSGQCNHGRPSYIKLKKSDIEKLFERC